MVPYARDSLFAGRDIPTLARWQAEGLRWSAETAGTRRSRPLEGAGPLAVFRAAEAAALVPLPSIAFELAAWSRPKVHDDCHAKVGKTLYSVPWRFIGMQVDARMTPVTVTMYLRGEVIKTHAFKAKGRQTDTNDYPPDKIAFLLRTPVWCRTRAAQVGPGCAELIGELLAVNVLHHLRSAQGILRMAERCGSKRLDAACARAIEAGDPSYRTVKGILAAGTETAPEAEATGADTPAFLRGPEAIVGGPASPEKAVVTAAEAIIAAEDILIETGATGGESAS